MCTHVYNLCVGTPKNYEITNMLYLDVPEFIELGLMRRYTNLIPYSEYMLYKRMCYMLYTYM